MQNTRVHLYGDMAVWYHLFIHFAMYCMLPVPVKWCTVCCLFTGLVHIILVAAVRPTSGEGGGDADGTASDGVHATEYPNVSAFV